MDNRGDEQTRDLSGLRARDPQEEQERKRRHQCAWARFSAAVWLVTVLSVLALYIYTFHTVPRVPPPRREPLRQPGGLLRQLTPYDGAWPRWSDGEHLSFVMSGPYPWRELGALIVMMPALVFRHDADEPSFTYLATISADGDKLRVVRLPMVILPWNFLRRPGSSECAMAGWKARMVKGEQVTRHGVWLWDAARHKDAPRELCSGEAICVSWSPDGRQLLVCSEAYYFRIAYWLVAPDTGRMRDIERPGYPRWIEDGQWSPDSRRIAFVCHRTEMSQDRRRRDFPVDAIWVVDTATGRGRLMNTGPLSGLLWLSDGRIVVWNVESAGSTRAVTRVGEVKLDAGRIRWFSWRLDKICTGAQEARGRVLVSLAPRGGQMRPDEADVWELSLADGSLRMLTNLAVAGRCAVSPTGERMTFASGDYGPMPGLWVLDLEPRTTAARR